MRIPAYLIGILIQYWVTESLAHSDSRRLYDDLFKKRRNGDYSYSPWVRPVSNASAPVILTLEVKLSQIMNVDEKRQVLTIHVKLVHRWQDTWLIWNPEEYGGVDIMYVEASNIWRPDICLYNNADGDFEVKKDSKVTVRSDGSIEWAPPVIYKSFCSINVEYFPFDEQNCHLKLSSWTYDKEQIDLRFFQKPDLLPNVTFKPGMDTKRYNPSVEWNLLDTYAMKEVKLYPCCPEEYVSLYFNITIRRKPLFYTVNLILPCVGISFLTILTFYLPGESDEKITLSISILISLSMFFLLLFDIIPPTSNAMPLLGRYLLLTMVLVCLSIFFTVIVLNLRSRGPTTHTMSPWMRKVFLNVLPGLFMMQRPKTEEVSPMSALKATLLDSAAAVILTHKVPTRPSKKYPNTIAKAHSNVKYIAQMLKNKNESASIKEDWKYVAMVVDRCCLWMFTTACVVGTIGIFLQAPVLYDNPSPIVGSIDLQ